MKARLCFGLVLALTLAAGARRARAADDMKTLLAAGERMLEALPALPVNHAETTYFEIQLNQRAVGVGELSLKAREVDGSIVLDYRHYVTIKLPTGVVMTLDVQAVLDQKYRPLAIDVDRSMTLPDGQAFLGTQSATIEGDKLILVAHEGGEKTTRELPAPKGRFVYGVDALVHRLDHKQKKPFALRNLDLESGGLADIHYQWTVNAQRKEQLNVSKDGGATLDEYFVFEWSGELIGYGKIDPPLYEHKTTASGAAEVKKLLEL